MTVARPTSLTDLSRVDRRCRAWRWRQRRRAEIIAGLGGSEDRLSAHQREVVELLLGVSQLLESMQAALAAGEAVDAERFLAISKEKRRLAGELGLPRTVPPTAPIRERLAASA